MVTRNPIIYKDAFLGEKTKEQADNLDKLLEQIENGLEGFPELESFIYNLPAESVELIKKNNSNKGIEKPLGKLRPYQTLGVRFLLQAQNAILTDSAGLGKTAQAPALINLTSKLKERRGLDNRVRFIYLTDLGLLEQTQNELIRFTALPVLTSSGKAPEVKKLVKTIEENDFHGIIASYSIAKSHTFINFMVNWVSENGKVDYLIVDESSVIKNKKSMNYEVLNVLKNLVCKKRVLLNATPFETDYRTLFNQLDFVDSKLLPYVSKFEEQFVKVNYLTKQIYGYKNLADLSKALRYVMYGKTRSELGVTIRGTSCSVILYPMSSVQRSVYNKTTYKEYVFDNISWLNPSLEFNPDNVPKLGILLDVVQSIGKQKLMVYCKFKDAQTAIQQYLSSIGVSSIILNGEANSSKKKADIVKRYVEEDIQVFITNIQKGLNLDFINHLFFYSFSNNAGMMNQVEGRIIRSQQIINKKIYIPLARTNEWQVLESIAENHRYKSMITKSEVSPLNLFLENMGATLDEVRKLEKDKVVVVEGFEYSIKNDYKIDFETRMWEESE